MASCTRVNTADDRFPQTNNVCTARKTLKYVQFQNANKMYCSSNTCKKIPMFTLYSVDSIGGTQNQIP